MDYLTAAHAAGNVTPINDEACSSPQTAGPKTYKTQRRNPTAKIIPLQPLQKAVESDLSIFARLAKQFTQLGLSLYPLDGQTVLVSSHKLGMSRTLPDLRAAQIYLRQIGGVQ